jgi:hypothetical protein
MKMASGHERRYRRLVVAFGKAFDYLDDLGFKEKQNAT